MKKYRIGHGRLAALTFLVSFLANATVASTATENSFFGQQLDETRDRLSLSDEQMTQLTPIFKSGFEKQKAILDSYNIDIANPAQPQPKLGLLKLRKLRSEMSAVRDDTTSKVNALLSPQQVTIYEALLEEREAAFRKRLLD